jgi:hypothetical protein
MRAVTEPGAAPDQGLFRSALKTIALLSTFKLDGEPQRPIGDRLAADRVWHRQDVLLHLGEPNVFSNFSPLHSLTPRPARKCANAWDFAPSGSLCFGRCSSWPARRAPLPLCRGRFSASLPASVACVLPDLRLVFAIVKFCLKGTA